MKKIVEKIKRLFKKNRSEFNGALHDVNHLVAHITTRPRRICSLITYRIIAVANADQFSDIERFVSNRKRYGQLNLDQKEEIVTISKRIIEEESKHGINARY